MKTGRTLNAVMQELAFQQKAKRDYIASAVGMRLRNDGHTFEMNHLENGSLEARRLSRQQGFSTGSLPRPCISLRSIMT